MVADEWTRHGECGLVVGATFPDELAAVRDVVGDVPILVPGVGAQRRRRGGGRAAGATTDGSGLDREQLAIDPLRLVGRRLRGRRAGATIDAAQRCRAATRTPADLGQPASTTTLVMPGAARSVSIMAW